MTSRGDELNGRYQLVRRLGNGGMGSVWEAHDKVLERTVAVKELISGFDSTEDIETRRKRVRREALALAKVEHPAIVTIHDLIYAKSGRAPWIVMGYAHGRSLDKIIREDPPLSERKIAHIGLAVLDGLMACHRCSVYHRDVKPANIVVGGEAGSEERVRLVDFGIARIAGEEPITAQTKVLGTPQFLAPELLNGKRAGPATDLWALAVTLYYALDGQAPFQAETIEAMFAAIATRNPPEPRGGLLADLVIQMLRKRVAERPDAGRVADALRHIAGRGDREGRRSGPWPGLGPGDVPRQHPSSSRSDTQSPQGDTQPVRSDTQPLRSGQRLTPLSGMPALSAVAVISRWPADRAAGELIALSEKDAAKIINGCDDTLGGKLLTAIAAERPARARKILEMVLSGRAGHLLDHMSSVAAAATLSLPEAADAGHILDRADTRTVVGALSEMSPGRASSIVEAMDVVRAGEVLGQTAIVKAAAILRNVSPASHRQVLLKRLPEPSRTLVARQLHDT